jgi:oligoribonuclease
MQHHFLWLDLETTGFDPHNGKILEWAAVLADDGRDGTFDEVQAFHSPIFYADVDAEVLPLCDDYVRNMHTVNGLFDEIRRQLTSSPLDEVDDFLAGLAGGPGSHVMLAGNSVHFDLGWVRVHMPKFAACLSHRVGDVSTLIEVDKAWGRGVYSRGGPAHRALDDVRESLRTAKRLRDAYFGAR